MFFADIVLENIFSNVGFAHNPEGSSRHVLLVRECSIRH